MLAQRHDRKRGDRFLAFIASIGGNEKRQVYRRLERSCVPQCSTAIEADRSESVGFGQSLDCMHRQAGTDPQFLDRPILSCPSGDQFTSGVAMETFDLT